MHVSSGCETERVCVQAGLGEDQPTGVGELEGQRPEALDTAQMEALIAEHLRERLQLLPEVDLANALHDFVEKVCVPAPLGSKCVQLPAGGL